MAQGSFWTGREGGIERAPIGSQQQMGAQNQMLQTALSGLQGSQPSFAPIEAHARKQFKQQTLPGIMERLTSMGGQRSSALGESLSGGAQDLESSLAAMGSQFGMQNRGQLMQMLGMGLQPQEQMFYRPGTQGFLGTLGGGLAQGLGALGGTLGGSLFGGGGGQNQILQLLTQLLGQQQGQGQQGGGSIQSNPSLSGQKFSF